MTAQAEQLLLGEIIRLREQLSKLEIHAQQQSGHLQEILRFVTRRVGQSDFFVDLVVRLSGTLQIDQTFVGELVPGHDTIHTVALCDRGVILDNITYDLAFTPCENVVGQGLCCYPDNIQALFPRDPLLADIGAQSYVGAPLWDSRGRALGIIVAIDRKPLVAPELAEILFQVVASEAAYELERRREDRKLRESQARFRSFFEKGLVGAAITGIDQGWLEVNDKACEILGYSRDELLRTSWAQTTHPDDVERNEALMNATLAGEINVYSLEKRYIRKDGQIVHAHVDVSCVRDGDGRADYFVTLIQDITEAKRTEAELERHRQHLEELVAQRTADLQAANQQLAALGRVKDEFVSNVSHELRTPITSLKLRQTLLRRQPERLTDHLAVMERETERLHYTIENLLELSRFDQGRTELKRTPVDLNLLISRYLADRAAITDSKRLCVSFSAKRDLPEIAADVPLLEETLEVLVTNAINYTSAGAQITLASLTRETNGRGWVGFEVADSGPGIPPDEQAHLFERFFRGQTGRQSGTPGTGLGLAIAKEIVTRHGGQIECHSSGVPGEGAHFTVWLPV